MNETLVTFVEPTVYQRIVGGIIGLALLAVTVRLIQQFRLKEEHALPWLAGGALLVLLCLFLPLLKLITGLIGAATPTTTLFAGCIVFLLVHGLYLTSTVSRHKKQIQQLVIELALERGGVPSARRDG